ncbi:MAG: hypothetical protein WBN35_06745 [Acidimicrobiia bacterium]|jgi:hypothetical protein
MTIEELRRAVRSLPGVASADVVPQPGAPPVVRLWTDGTIPDAVVQRAIQLLVAKGAANGSARVHDEVAASAPVAEIPSDEIPDVVDDVPPATKAAKRRVGLGKTLEETLPGAFAETAPSHLATDTIPDAVGVRRLLRLAIEETSDGVDVRAIDDFGRETEAAVGPGPDGLTVAVASAVARLRGFPSPLRTAINTRDVDGTTVVTVLVELPGGEKAAGAAIVTGGLPFTVGRAVDSALTAL